MKTKPQSSRSDNGLLGLDLAAGGSIMGMVLGVQVVPIGLEDYLRQPWSTIPGLYGGSRHAPSKPSARGRHVDSVPFSVMNHTQQDHSDEMPNYLSHFTPIYAEHQVWRGFTIANLPLHAVHPSNKFKLSLV